MIADREASQSGARSPSIYRVLAIFGGAILAGFGLVTSTGGRASRELPGNTYRNAVGAHHGLATDARISARPR
jgi:hypothetical protein